MWLVFVFDLSSGKSCWNSALVTVFESAHPEDSKAVLAFNNWPIFIGVTEQKYLIDLIDNLFVTSVNYLVI